MNLGSSSLGSVELGGVGGLDPITGTLSITLDAVTVTSSGAVTISGLIASTLSAQTLSSTGAVTVSGSLISTLGNVTASFSAGVVVGGSLISTLSGVTQSGSGAVSITGSLSGSQSVTFLGGSGVRTGTMQVTLGDVQFRFRGKVTGDPPVNVEPSSACLTFDSISNLSGLQSDNLLDGGNGLEQDSEVEVPCNN